VFVDVPASTERGTRPKSIDLFLSDALNRRVYCGLAQTSHYRSNRKALLTLADRHGRVLAYCKVATNDLTRALIEREADTLRALGAHRFEHLTLPTVLWAGDVGTARLLVVSALKPPLAVGRPQRDRVLRAMTELALSNPGPRTSLTDSTWWAELNKTVEGLPPGNTRDVLTNACAQLGDMYGDRTVAFGRWHGDWTRWNTAETSTGVLAWDLERSEEAVPIGFDAVHQRLISLVENANDVDPFLSAFAACSVEPCSVDNAQPAPSAAVARGWLLTLVLRAVQDARTVPSTWAEQRVARVVRLLSAVTDKSL
jgi:hypothetical protein